MLISFEGPIAAGKTTLAHLYSAHATGRLVLEEFTTNQFLEDFYADNDRWSLQMQLWFLLDRHAQLSALAKEENDLLVADYAFIKNEPVASKCEPLSCINSCFCIEHQHCIGPSPRLETLGA